MLGQSVFKVQSSISRTLIRYTILKGTLIASVGGFLLVYCGGFISPPFLHQWGIFIWTAGFALVAYGLIPYKALLQLMIKPNEIIFDETRGQMHYMSRGKHQFVILVSLINRIKYIEGRLTYGIQFVFKDEKQKTIFLPYFSKRAYEKVRNYVEPSA